MKRDFKDLLHVGRWPSPTAGGVRMRLRFILVGLVATGLSPWLRPTVAETLGVGVRPAVGFAAECDLAAGEALKADTAGYRLINGVDDQVSTGWFASTQFQKLPVDFSSNFVAASQYWTQVAGAIGFSETKRRFKAPHTAVADLYTRFSRSLLENYDFAGGGGPLGSSRDLQLAIWHVRRDLNLSPPKSEQQPSDWLSNPLSISGIGDGSAFNGGSTGGSAVGSVGGGNSGSFGSGGGGGGGGSASSEKSTGADSGVGSGAGGVNGMNPLVSHSSAATPAVTVAVVPLPASAWGGLALISLIAGSKCWLRRVPSALVAKAPSAL